ncbi:VPLPA-CTERM sorting domain-containing protein [Amaricoccus sp.]|uniref:VPLPA-CTERM sorting domain-containing protein n=1 Tax=Amaricoccus sp. TaxID=1872485 RepID=UPI001B402FC4|nr:VPLPA-CTERM sorting domain-containing protein [Amaricoccus sp.]MBP7001438.1 VPLPA-CTERM sorting domain-containing protein [Amaricoccus sp.]
MSVISRFAVAALVAGAAFAAAPSQAATCSTASLSASTACQGKLGTGAGAAEMNAFKKGVGAFGVTGWTDLGRVETGAADGAFADGALALTSEKGGTAGSWSLAPGLKFAKGAAYALILEGCRETVAYLLDTSSASGAWSNLDLLGKNGKKLTEMHAATLVGTASPAPVPLPAAGLLMIGGLASLGAAARRRSA